MPGQGVGEAEGPFLVVTNEPTVGEKSRVMIPDSP